MSEHERLEDALRMYEQGAADSEHPNPFKFLDAYEKNDRDIFFGRAAEVEDLRSRYYRSRVLVVYGESGSGKTSLIQCGLANAVPEEDAEFVYVRTNVDPVRAAKAALGADPASSFGIDRIVEERAAAISKTVVLVLDQFEELFIFQPESVRRRFVVEEVGRLIQRKLDAKVIFSIREEYFARMTEIEKAIPGLFENRYWLQRMNAHEARSVIVEPCARYGIAVDQGLPERLLARLRDNRGDVDLPYLQILLDRLFRTAEKRGAPLRFLEGDLETLGEMGDVLFGFLEERVHALADPDLAKDVLKLFVTGDRTKRPVDARGVCEAIVGQHAGQTIENVQALLLRFVESRILKQEQAEAPYELRHDTLAEAVSRWLTPMEEERLKVKTLVESRYAEFRNGGSLIESAEVLKRIEPYVPHLGLGDDVQQFLARSRRAIERARRSRWVAAFSSGALLLAMSAAAGAKYVTDLRLSRNQTEEALQQARRQESRAKEAQAQEKSQREKAELATREAEQAREQIRIKSAEFEAIADRVSSGIKSLEEARELQARAQKALGKEASEDTPIRPPTGPQKGLSAPPPVISSSSAYTTTGPPP